MQPKKLTVLFDANPLINPHKSGVGYYAEGLIAALAAAYPDQLQLVGYHFNFLGRGNTDGLITAPNIRYKSSHFIHPKVLSLLRRVGLQLPLELFVHSRGDIALFPNFVTLPSIRGVKKAVVVHDLCYVDMPDFIQAPNRAFLNRFVPKSVADADIVFTISQFTKRAIETHYHADPSKITITPIPPSKPVLNASTPKIQGKYILFMSTLEPRKDFITLIRAYSALPSDLKNAYSLVLAGGPGWHNTETTEEIKKLQDAGEKIIVTGYISDQERAQLYAHASLFVMPSIYEGFGMPLLEAMSYRVPVVASDIAVFHEVAGNAARYAAPGKPDEFMTAITKVLNDAAVRQELIAAGQEQLKKYNWHEVAITVYETLQRLANKRP